MKEKIKPISLLNKRLFTQNKGRSMVTITAIALTTLMFTTLFVLSQSMSKNIIEMTFRQTGYDAQVSFKSITDEQIRKLKEHPDVKEIGESLLAGMGQGHRLNGRQVELRYADKSYAEHSFALPDTGRMPEAKDEIALDEHVLDRLGVPLELGAHVTLEWIADFTEEENRISEFTLCGFWEGNESSYASLAWVSRDFVEAVMAEAGTGNGKDMTDVPPSSIAGIHMAQVSLYNDKQIEQDMERILEDIGLAGLKYGVNLAYDPDMNRMSMQESLPMYLGMLLVFAAGYLIIYNIFQISVTADIQFYGRLKTLGMTARQLKKLIYGQAGRLCLLGIPAGMIPGYLLGACLVPVLVNMPSASVSVSPVIFIGSALFAVFTVLISCMRPAKMAGKVSPMEALRYNDVQGVKRSSKKRSGSAGLFALAWSNLGRNKKRTVTVVLSLTLGLTLLSAFYAKNAAFDMEKYLSDLTVADYQIDAATSQEYIRGYDPYDDTLGEELTEKVRAMEGLEDIGYLYSHDTEITLEDGTIANLRNFYTDDVLDDWGTYDPAGVESLLTAIGQKKAGCIVYGMDGITLDAYTSQEHLQKGVIDITEFVTGGYVLAIAPHVAEEKRETLPTASVGDTVIIEGKSYTVMAVVDDINPITEGAHEGGSEDGFYLDFILPTEAFKESWPENTPRKLFFNVEETQINEAREMLDAYSDMTDIQLNVTSRASMAAQYERETRSSAVMGNVIGIVIALVGVLNFVNSMVTAIVSRRKEFAMMQSVGMTKKQLCRLLVYEGMDYACFTLLFSYALSALAVGIGVRAMVEGGFTTFRFTLLPLVACTPVLLLFALLIPYLCFRNIEKLSLVERLRAAE